MGPIHDAEVDGTLRSARTAQWQLRDDPSGADRSARGYLDVADNEFHLINPVIIERYNHQGLPIETVSAVRDNTQGKLSLDNTFSQSDYVAWTTFQYTDCCTLASQRVYHNIPESGIGNPVEHYLQTDYGYDFLKRRNRILSPGGHITKIVHDVRDREIARYVGTNDSEVGNDMELMQEHVYDHGADGGDGHLTRSIVHVDDTSTRATDYLYDWRGRRVAVDSPGADYETILYDNLNRPIRNERRDGHALGKLIPRTDTLYDHRGRVDRSVQFNVDPDTGNLLGNRSQNRTFDAAGQLVRQSPSGSMEYQTFVYDSLRRRTHATDPLGHTSIITYDAAGNATSQTDPTSRTTTHRFDPIGRRVATIDALGNRTTQVYGNHGQVFETINPLGETSTQYHDHAGRLILQLDPPQAEATYEYDADGNQIVVTDALGQTMYFVYDHLGRQTNVTDALGHTTSKVDNRVGEVTTETDAKGSPTTHQYDSHGQQIATTDRLGHTTVFAYTPMGQLASLTDAEGQQTGYRYDGYGRQVETRYPDHVDGTVAGDINYGITTFDYDQLDRVRVKTDQLGDTVTFHYDTAGRLLSRDYRTRVNSPAGTIADTDTFTYDAASRMLTATSGRYSNDIAFTYDTVGRKTSEYFTMFGQT